MSELLNYIKSQLDDAIESEDNMMKIYSRLAKAYEGLEKEKFEDIAGLKMPNFFTFMQGVKANKEELEIIRFAVETKIKNNEEIKKGVSPERNLERGLGRMLKS